MKELKNYITESNGVDSNIKKLLTDTIKNVDFSKFEEIKPNDPNRFEISKQNEKLFIKQFNDFNLYAISSQQYYEMINPGKTFENLSRFERADFDTKYGDIILLDKNNNPKYFIDLKVSENYIGAVNMGSVCNFCKEGIYVCVNKNKPEEYRIFSHEKLVNLIKENKLSINNPSFGKKPGYRVHFNKELYFSECYIKGKDIMSIFSV